MKIINIFKQTIIKWMGNMVPMLSAALGFYTLFSLGPLLLVLVYVAGFIVEAGDVQEELLSYIESVTGVSGSAIVQELLNNYSIIRENIFLNIVTLVILLLAASTVVGQLRYSLNVIFEVKARPGGFTDIIKKKLISFGLILLWGFFIVAIFLMQNFLVFFSRFINEYVAIPDITLSLIYWIVSFIAFTLIFASMYVVLPDCRVKWRSIWSGALFTTVLFMIGQYLISLYLARTPLGTAYGAAGSLVIILLWIYYSAQIVLFGAQFTKVQAEQSGTGICRE